MPGPYTRTQLETMVSEELEDSSYVRYTQAKIREYLNKAMAEFCERSRIRRATTTIDVTAENAVVDLSSTTPRILEVLRVALPSSEDATDETTLRYLTLEELERENSDWRNERGQPKAYVRWDQGELSIRLYPEPDTNFSSYMRSNGLIDWNQYPGVPYDLVGLGDTDWNQYAGAWYAASQKYGGLRVDYVAAATDFSGASDTPLSISEIPARYHEALAHYATARCLAMDTEMQQIERSKFYMAQFEDAVAQASRLADSDFQRKPVKQVRLQL